MVTPLAKVLSVLPGELVKLNPCPLAVRSAMLLVAQAAYTVAVVEIWVNVVVEIDVEKAVTETIAVVVDVCVIVVLADGNVAVVTVTVDVRVAAAGVEAVTILVTLVVAAVHVELFREV